MSIMFQPGESVLGKYNILDDKKGNAYVTTLRLVIGNPKDEGIDSEFEWSQVLEVNRSTDEIMIQTNVTNSQGAYQSFNFKFDNVEEVYNTIQSRSQRKSSFGGQGGFAPSPHASKHKNPTIALILGLLFFPGLGVLYIGKISEGIIFLSSGVLILIAVLVITFFNPYSGVVIFLMVLPIIFGIDIYALYYGYSRAKIFNSYVEQNAGKTPW